MVICIFGEIKSRLCCFKLCLALRYLHKEKRIVHRDVTPNNIMLGDKDKVTVSKYKHFLFRIPEFYSGAGLFHGTECADGNVLYQHHPLEQPLVTGDCWSLEM